VGRLGRAAGRIAFDGLRLRRRQTLENLRLAFGDAMAAPDRIGLARDCYRHFGTLAFELLAMGHRPLQRAVPRVRLHDLERLREALRRERGAILVSGHLGNWEQVGLAISAAGLPLSLFVGGQHNPLVDELLNQNRRATGSHTIHKGPNAKELLKALRANRIVALLADQHDPDKRHYVAFFGRPVSAAPGPARLARRTGAPLLFGDYTRDPDGCYGLRVEPVPFETTDDEEGDVLRITQALFDRLEAAVRRHPAQYFWMHRRWRPIPPQVRLSEQNRAFLAGRVPPETLPSP
jgi:KDO2-lipid IV(A) lauroyltransferase